MMLRTARGRSCANSFDTDRVLAMNVLLQLDSRACSVEQIKLQVWIWFHWIQDVAANGEAIIL